MHCNVTHNPLVCASLDIILRFSFFSQRLLFFFSSLYYNMSTEYGAVNTAAGDEEAPINTTTVRGDETRWQKCRRTLGTHGHRIFIAWFIIIAITAVLTISFHFSLLPSHHPVDDDLVPTEQCVSDRSWFLALLLSIFFGPFGKRKKRNDFYVYV